MDLGSIFLILALAILVVLFVARPFNTKNARTTMQTGHEVSSLLAEREGILRALQELDFDHALHKIPEEEYPQQRQALLLRGADVLRRLDELQAQKTTTDNAAADPLEAAIAARRRATVTVEDANDPLEAAIAARRRVRSEKAGGFCTQCGAPLLRSDKFCPKCGTPVAA
ncbi:MAG: hypothetical protein Fur0018_14750 [Anaerolineales bacterium]